MISQVQNISIKNLKFKDTMKAYADRLVDDLIQQSSENERLISEVVLDKVWDYENIIKVLQLQAYLLFELA